MRMRLCRDHDSRALDAGLRLTRDHGVRLANGAPFIARSRQAFVGDFRPELSQRAALSLCACAFRLRLESTAFGRGSSRARRRSLWMRRSRRRWRRSSGRAILRGTASAGRRLVFRIARLRIALRRLLLSRRCHRRCRACTVARDIARTAWQRHLRAGQLRWRIWIVRARRRIRVRLGKGRRAKRHDRNRQANSKSFHVGAPPNSAQLFISKSVQGEVVTAALEINTRCGNEGACAFVPRRPRTIIGCGAW